MNVLHIFSIKYKCISEYSLWNYYVHTSRFSARAPSQNIVIDQSNLASSCN